MNDAVYSLGNLSVYGFGILATFSFLWGSFVFYKKAVLSHFEEFHILDGVVMAAFWAFIVGRAVYVIGNLDIFWNHFPRIFLLSNFPGIDRWGVVAGVCLGIFWTVRRVKGKFLDWLDMVFLGLMAGIAVFYSGLAFLTYSWQYAVLAMAYLLIFIPFWSIEDKYRTFGWYKSNKTSARSGLITGFSVSTIGLFFMIELLLLGRMNLVMGLWSGVLFVGGLVLVYIRSGRTVAEDIKYITKHGRK